MATDNNSLEERYEVLELRSEQTSQSLSKMMTGMTGQLLRQHGSELVQGAKELAALAMQSSTYLSKLGMEYGHRSEKFEEMIRGAERRLDRQLDDLSMMRRQLLTLTSSGIDPQILTLQRQLLDAIGQAQDSFNREIDRLYIIRKTKCSRLGKRSVHSRKTNRYSNLIFFKKIRPGFAGGVRLPRLSI